MLMKIYLQKTNTYKKMNIDLAIWDFIRIFAAI